MSFEVGEHIDKDKTEMFVYNLTKYSKKYIIFTSASTGQGGTGHINLREQKFWIDLIKLKKFIYKPKLVDKCRNDWEKINVPEYILKNLMIFKRRKA